MDDGTNLGEVFFLLATVRGFILKKSLGKTGRPASNQTKIQFLKKNVFIIEHIKKN